MKNSFNLIAPFYDSLSSLVYGKNLINAKKAFLNKISSGSQILLMGGGTGNILNELFHSVPDITIDFVEPSSAMIEIAEKNLTAQFRSQVNFVCGDHHSIPKEKKFDVVTSFFVIDCFKQNEAIEFGIAITSRLKENGVWLFSDFFYTNNKLQHLLIWVMYRFFKVIAKISSNKLPDYELLFQQLHFSVEEEKTFMKGMIQTKVLRRATSQS
ncbi:MAG: class I SAM-dependent methyltransferase [Chitinophagales bacterium]|nr:class I SAM-dependent methyltransferase [Chitinophagales bacterium]